MQVNMPISMPMPTCIQRMGRVATCLSSRHSCRCMHVYTLPYVVVHVLAYVYTCPMHRPTVRASNRPAPIVTCVSPM